MRKLVLGMSITFDGFVAGPNGENDWVFRYRSPDGMAWVAENLWDAGVRIMGSRTYQEMASYWPYADGPSAAPMNGIPKVVFSRSGPVAPHPAKTTAVPTDATRKALAGWTEARFATGEIAAEVAALKRQEGKNIAAFGGVRFARSLISPRTGRRIPPLGISDCPRTRASVVLRVIQADGMKLVSSTRFSPAGTMANVYVPE